MNRRHEGFSLVEVLVGLLIGMLAVVIVMQVFTVSEASKRTTTGGADATTNGAIALYMVEREARMAGWGLETSLYLGRTTAKNPILPGCVTMNTYCGGHTGCASMDWSFAPLSIQDGASGGPDTITLRYFSDPNSGNFVPASTGTVYANKLNASNVPELKVSNNFGCKKGDLVLVGEEIGPTCTVVQVSADPGVIAGNLLLEHQSGSNAWNAYNNPDWDAVVGKPPVVTGSARVLSTCFSPGANGPTSRHIFSVDAGKGILQRTDDSAAAVITDAIADSIVDLQAQYGIAQDGAQTVSAWKNATAGDGWDNPVPKAGASGTTTSNRLQNIKAVRIAILARSAQYEKPKGAACDATAGTPGTPGATGWSSWATFKTANYPADWQCYRYRAFEIVVPVRNIIWGNS